MATLKIPCSTDRTQAEIKLHFSIFWSEMEVLKELNLFKKALKQIKQGQPGNSSLAVLDRGIGLEQLLSGCMIVNQRFLILSECEILLYMNQSIHQRWFGSKGVVFLSMCEALFCLCFLFFLITFLCLLLYFYKRKNKSSMAFQH